MIFKEVKQYSNRQRIDLNKKDNLEAGSEVVILTRKEFDEIEKDYLDLQDKYVRLENQVRMKQEQEQNLKEIIENVTAPIYENHKKELEIKDIEIKQLQGKLNIIRKSCSQFNVELMDLNALDILFRSKHKKLIKEFNNTIFVNVDGEVVNADVKTITGE